MFYQNKVIIQENTCAHENNTCAHENKNDNMNTMTKRGKRGTVKK